jgi:hypothetical protein
MSKQDIPAGIQVTKVKWNEIEKVGYPGPELRTNSNGAPRTFLVRGEWSLYTAFVFNDGSGFDTGGGDGAPDDAAKAWAIIDGF